MDNAQVGSNQIGGDRKVSHHSPAPSPPIVSTPNVEVEPVAATPKRKAGGSTRPINTVQAGDGDPRHGSTSTYSNYMCRCDLCRAAQAAYMRDLRRRRRGQAAN